jgi:transcriptional regulator
MYVNPLHALDDRETLHSLMAAFPLGAWVCQGRQGLVANDVPFLLDSGRGPFGTLIGHVSRANPVWRELGQAAPSVVMFRGAQAYITPSWYPGKVEHGRVVPTWNYVVAHAHGQARAVEDRDWMLDMLNRLTDAHEAGQTAPWRVADAPSSFIDSLLRAVVGIEIPIERLEGKLKASQDEARQDRVGTACGLQAQACGAAVSMADWVLKALAADQAT